MIKGLTDDVEMREMLLENHFIADEPSTPFDIDVPLFPINDSRLQEDTALAQALSEATPEKPSKKQKTVSFAGVEGGTESVKPKPRKKPVKVKTKTKKTSETSVKAPTKQKTDKNVKSGKKTNSARHDSKQPLKPKTKRPSTETRSHKK